MPLKKKIPVPSVWWPLNVCMTQNSVKLAVNKQFCLHSSFPLAFTLTLCSFALYNPRHLRHGMKNYEVRLAS